MISLILCSYRPGGFDIFTKSFPTSGEPVEVVVIDDYPGRADTQDVPYFLKKNNINLGWYGKSKPKSIPESKCGLSNAYNTALSHAKGDYLIFVSDYTFLPPNWNNHWILVRDYFEKQYGKVLISGSAIEYSAIKPIKPGNIFTWDGVPMGCSPKYPWVPTEFETFYFGARPEFLISEINGVDERADHCHMWPVSSKVAQAKILGYKLIVEQRLCAHMIDHREWDDINNIGHPHPISRWDSLWKIAGESRSANAEPSWQVPSPNPFNLVEMRKANGIHS